MAKLSTERDTGNPLSKVPCTPEPRTRETVHFHETSSSVHPRCVARTRRARLLRAARPGHRGVIPRAGAVVSGEMGPRFWHQRHESEPPIHALIGHSRRRALSAPLALTTFFFSITSAGLSRDLSDHKVYRQNQVGQFGCRVVAGNASGSMSQQVLSIPETVRQFICL